MLADAPMRSAPRIQRAVPDGLEPASHGPVILWVDVSDHDKILPSIAFVV